MQNLEINEMQVVIGGATLSGAIVSAASTLFKTVLGIGQAAGSGIRRLVYGILC